MVTDKPLFDLGYADKVTRILDTINVHHQVRPSACRGCLPWASWPARVSRSSDGGVTSEHCEPGPGDLHLYAACGEQQRVLTRSASGCAWRLLPLPQVFYHVTPDPTLACIEAGLKEIDEFKPDIIIAMGGGSPMDAAKVRPGEALKAAAHSG